MATVGTERPGGRHAPPRLAGAVARCRARGQRPALGAGHADVEGRPGIRLLSHTADGSYPDSDSYPRDLTADGRWYTFENGADLLGDGRGGGRYLADTDTGALQRAPFGNLQGISRDGRYLAVTGSDAFGTPYLARIDRTTGQPQYLQAPAGSRFSAISDDGGTILVSTYEMAYPSTSLTHWYAIDVASNTATDVDGDASGEGGEAALLSGDGHTVVFGSRDPAVDPRIGDGRNAILRRDLTTGRLDVLAVAQNIYAGFVSRDAGVITIMQNGSTLVVTPSGDQEIPDQVRSGTPDGRYLVVGQGSTLYRYTVADGTRVLVTALPSGAPAGGQLISRTPISDDGDVVAFESTGDGIVPGTVHGMHLYRRTISAATTELVCCNIDSPVRTADDSRMSADGRRITFQSWQRLESADTMDHWDVFAWDADAVPATTTSTSTTAAPSTTSTTVPQTTTTSTTSTTVPQTTTTSTTVPPTTTTTTAPPPPAPPVVSIADAHVAEDAGQPMTWTLSLDHASSSPVTVRWWSFADTSAPSDRRATADKDFKPTAGTVTFAPGETTRTVTALVFDDAFLERDEWFSAAIIDATGATVGRAKAVGVINDDESARLWAVPRSLSLL